MRSFILLERPEDRRRNRLLIFGFLLFTIIISYIIYGSVTYGLSKLEIYSYNDPSIYGTNNTVYLKMVNVVCGDNNKFNTYIAKSNLDRERGLSVFNKIKSNEAMIFSFNTPDKYSFWMKGMKFAIDIVWLDQDKKIVDIKKNVAVNTYPEMFVPIAQSMYVLEFNAGTMDNSNIKIGDVCNFDSLRLK